MTQSPPTCSLELAYATIATLIRNIVKTDVKRKLPKNTSCLRISAYQIDFSTIEAQFMLGQSKK